MSDEVNALFDELKTQINEIETQLAALRKDTKLAPDARADKLTALNEKCNAAKKTHRSLKLELRELPKDKAKALEPQSKEYDAKIAKLSTEVLQAKVSGDRGVLVGSPVSGDVGGAQETEEQIREKIDKTAAASLSSTERSLAMLEKTVEIGNATNQKLQEQTEQMKRIQNDSDKINTHAEKAKKVLGDMESFFGGIFGKKKPDPKTDVAPPAAAAAKGAGAGATVSTGAGSSAGPAASRGAKGGTTVSDSTKGQLSEQASKDVAKTDDNLDKMSDLLGSLNSLAVNMNNEVKNQSGLVDGLHAGIDKNQSEVTGLTDRTQKLLKKG